MERNQLAKAVESYIIASMKGSTGDARHDHALFSTFKYKYGNERFAENMNLLLDRLEQCDVLEYKAKPWGADVIAKGIAIFRDRKQPSNENTVLDVLDNPNVPESVQTILSDIFKDKFLTGFLYANFNIMAQYYNQDGSLSKFPIRYGNRFYVVVDESYQIRYLKEFYIESAFPELAEDEQYMFYVSYKDVGENHKFSLRSIDELFHGGAVV